MSLDNKMNPPTMAPARSDADADPDSTVGQILQSQGVTRMEALYREAKTNRKSLWLVAASVLVCAWAFSLDSSTTSYYQIDASSHFKQHSSVLSTLAIATSMIGAVCKPFIAKISDITSRPYTYLLTLFFYRRLHHRGYLQIYIGICRGRSIRGDRQLRPRSHKRYHRRRSNAPGMAWVRIVHAVHPLHHQHLVCREDRECD